MILERFEAGSIKTVESVENEMDLALPADYKRFLLEYNGAKVINGSFHLQAIEEDVLLHILFGTELEKRVLTLEFWQKEYGEDIPDKSLLIGNVHGGAFILLIVNGKNDGVYLYDHAFFYDRSGEDENTYLIAESFTLFLDMLYK